MDEEFVKEARRFVSENCLEHECEQWSKYNEGCSLYLDTDGRDYAGNTYSLVLCPLIQVALEL